MRYQTLTLTTLAVAVVANPVALTRREDETTYDENGNLRLQFSKESVSIGGIELDRIFDSLNEACGSNMCDTNDIELLGQAMQSEEVTDIKLTLGPSSDSYGEDLRDNLFDAWKASVKAVASCKDQFTTVPCANPMVYCNNKPIKTTQCEVPQFWGITYQQNKTQTTGLPAMKTDLKIDPVESSVCEDIMQSLSAVAGAVSGAAGGTFTLLSFACK